MKYEKVVIKQIPDDTSVLTGLAKYGRSKMPGTMDSLPATLSPDGRYITGFDEDGYDLQNIEDKELKDQIKKERKELRESLEKLTGQPDLSATSSFWETFRITLRSDSDLTLNRPNPLDVVRYYILVSNGYAAPDKEAASNPDYIHCKYYCFVEEREAAQDVSTFRKRDNARSELVKIAENSDHAFLLAKYLVGGKVKKGMKEDTVYRILSEYISDLKEPENVKRFTKAAKLSAEDLQFKVVVDEAVKRKIIKVKEGYFQRGQVTLGKSLPDIYSNLKKPEFATEFLSIQEELESE